MAATEGPQFISETLSRLTSLEQQQEGDRQSLGELNQFKANLDTILNSKISAILAAQGNQNRDRDSFSKWPILESKSVQNLGNVSDSKSYRDWNRKLKNCIEQFDQSQDRS